MEKTKRTKRKNRKIRLTDEQKNALIGAYRKEKRTRISKRIQCVLLKEKGFTHRDIAGQLGTGIGTVSAWLSLYEERGLWGLRAWNYRGSAPRLDAKQLQELKERIRETPFSVAQEAVDYVRDTFQIEYHPRYMPRLLKKTAAPAKSRN